MLRSSFLIGLPGTALLLFVLLAFGLLAGAASAQVPIRKEPPRIEMRLIAGRLYARADLLANGKKVPAHLLLDLGRPDALALHENTAALLAMEPGQELDADFGAFTAAELMPDVSRLRFLEYLTAEYAAELSEIPVVGILGASAFQNVRFQLDYRKNLLTLLPPRQVETEAEAPPADPGATELPPPETAPEPAGEAAPPAKQGPTELVIPMSARSGYYRFKVQVDGGRFLDAAPATADPDTWISAGIAEELEHPGGDLETMKLGELEVHKYVALRPGDAPDNFPGQPDVLLGNNLLSHFEVTIDPQRKEMRLVSVRPPKFPEEEQACFIALAGRDAAALEKFISKHANHRLARDAGGALLTIRLEADPLEPEALRTAVQHYGRTRPVKRRSRMMLQLLKQLAAKQPDAYDVVRQTALDIAIRFARSDEDATAVHRTRSEIGEVLLEKGELREAYRHLLSAAFGLPQDGLINLRLGRLYEKKGQEARAWSRYLQAAITEEGAADGMDGLKRLADKSGVKTPYDMDEMEKLLEGRIPAFEPASTFEPKDGKRPSRVVLAELFTCVASRGAAAPALAFDGLLAHFEHGEVALLEHHIHAPGPDPLVSPAAMNRAQRFGVRGTPVVLLDGHEVVQKAGGAPEKAAASFRLIHKAVEKQLEEASPWKLAVSASVDQGELSARVRIEGPAASGLRLRLYLAERSVLYPGRSKIVLHRYVTRAELARGGVQVEAAAGVREIERSHKLGDVRDRIEQHLDAVEDQIDREFSLRPVELTSAQLVVVAFLEDERGRVQQAAMWEASPRRGE